MRVVEVQVTDPDLYPCKGAGELQWKAGGRVGEIRAGAQTLPQTMVTSAWERQGALRKAGMSKQCSHNQLHYPACVQIRAEASGRAADIKTCFTMRDAFALLDYEDPTIVDVKRLLLQARGWPTRAAG